MIRAALIVCLALAVTACSTPRRLDAAGDVHALMVAIRDDDEPAFDRHVDRGALAHQLEGRLLDGAESTGSDVARAFAAIGARPVARAAVNALVRPEVFRGVAAYYGYRPDEPLPNVFVIAGALRPAGGGRVCAARRGSDTCILTFALEDGHWRLVGFDGDLGLLRR